MGKKQSKVLTKAKTVNVIAAKVTSVAGPCVGRRLLDVKVR
jgi:hypothetical protein